MNTEEIRKFSESLSFPPKHVQYLSQLRASGFRPKVIYDIGASFLHWTNIVSILWPDADIIAFDAWDKSEFLYKERDMKYFSGVLSDVDGKIVKFYQNDSLPMGNSYYRELPNPTVFPEDEYVIRKTRTLDSVVNENGFPLPDFVKIDVQGAEMDVIKGGLQTLGNAQHMIVEMQKVQYNEGAPLVDVTLPFIENLGWKCVAPLFCDNGPDGDYGFARVTHSVI